MDSAAAATTTADPSPVTDAPLSGWRRALLVALFFVCSCVAVAIPMDKYPWPSPIDEVTHYDYLLQAPAAPVNGERISQKALRLWACRTSGPEYVLQLPACSTGRFDPAQFPGEGYSTSGSTPPLYYTVTALAVRPAAWVTGKSDFTLARAFGAVWLTGLMLVAYGIARQLRVTRLTAAASALVTGLASGVASSAATLGPETATAVTGGLVVLLTLSYDGTRRRAAYVLLAVLAAALTKFTAFTAVGAAVIYLVVWPFLAARREPVDGEARVGRRESWLLAGASLAVFAVVSFLWGLRFSQTSLVDPDTIPINILLHADTLDWGAISEGLLYTFVSPTSGSWIPGALVDQTNQTVVTVLGGLSVVAILAAAAALRTAPRAAALGLGVLLVAVTGPFVLTALNFYVNHLGFPLPSRYGFALLAPLAGLIAWLLRSPGPTRALVLLAGLSMVNLLT